MSPLGMILRRGVRGIGMAAGAAVRGLQDTVLHGVFVDDGLKRLFGRGEGAGIGAAENGLAVHGGDHAQLAVFSFTSKCLPNEA